VKIKLIAAAVAALGSLSASAGVLDPATATVAAANYIYIAGASAQSQALNTVAKSLFDTPADVVQITPSGAGCPDTGNIQKHVAYLGLRGTVPTLIVYRNSGGSGSGTLQLLAKTTAAPQIVSAGKVVGLPASAATGVSGAWIATGTNCAVKLPAIALQDVLPAEHTTTVTGQAGNANYDALSVIKAPIATGLQGFGVAVSGSLYTALQTAQGLTATQQPSIRRSDYASLSNIGGTIKTAADLLRNPADTGTIEIARRVATSGTQASSEIFFLNAKTAGAQTPATAVDFPIASIATNGIGVTEGASTGDAKTRLNGAGYVIGIMSLENVPAGTETWKWVALDGVSPNYAYDLATSSVIADPALRQNVAAGSYQFAYESFVVYKDNAYSTLANALGAKMADTSQSDLVGFAYEDLPGTWAAWDNTTIFPATGNVNKQSRVSRAGNNLNPLQY
jgi:hypothetical protein